MNWWLVANHLRHGMMTVRQTRMLDVMNDHEFDAGAMTSRACHLK
jgi:hypothetical protein